MFPPQPMLATSVGSAGLPTDGEHWAFEVKWDGVRALAKVDSGHVRVAARTGSDITATFPELAGLAELGADADLVLDGEIVALEDGRPNFAAVAGRMHASAARARHLAMRTPVTYLVFDVLRCRGVDLTRAAWSQRREVLQRLMSVTPAALFDTELVLGHRTWQLGPCYDDGAALMMATAAQGLEGVVAKRRASPYRQGVRSADWVKLQHRRTQSCVVGGWCLERTGDRVGALLLGIPGSDGLHYIGSVGAGVGVQLHAVLQQRLRDIPAARSPFVRVPVLEAGREVTWVQPQLVVEVRHLGHELLTAASASDDVRLRQPVLLAIRTDLLASQVCWE